LGGFQTIYCLELQAPTLLEVFFGVQFWLGPKQLPYVSCPLNPSPALACRAGNFGRPIPTEPLQSLLSGRPARVRWMRLAYFLGSLRFRSTCHLSRVDADSL